MTNPDSVLIVRLSSMGDIVHTLPSYAILRSAFPLARIEWLVESRFGEVLEETEGLDRIVSVDFARLPGVIRHLRSTNYAVVLDFQGLVKSALFATLARGRRVVGFSSSSVRERPAALFYSETVTPAQYGHVLQKNFSLLERIPCPGREVSFPWKSVSPAERSSVPNPYAVLIPGASWLHKRWPAGSFGELAFRLHKILGLRSVLIHGATDEYAAAEKAAAASRGAGTVSPHLTFHQLRTLLQEASVVVGGDTGPLHVSWSLGTPTVGIFGPTDPRRNGPLAANSSTVTRYSACSCRYKRKCSARVPCMMEIPVEEVLDAVVSTFRKTAQKTSR